MDTGAIILITSFAVPVLVIIGILWWLRKRHRQHAREAALLRKEIDNALPANARIVSCELATGAGSINNYRIVRMHLEILPMSGDPFHAQTTWFVSLLHLAEIRVDHVISIKYNPAVPAKIFPDVPWAHYSEGY